jgi:hypothetical protein
VARRRQGSPRRDRAGARISAQRRRRRRGRPARRAPRKFVQTRRPIRPDGLFQLRALEGLDADTPLERRETVIADLEEDGEGWTLAFEGRELRFPSQAGPELEACYEADEPFRLADLPGDLDAEGRLVLARRLVREGFLRIRGA